MVKFRKNETYKRYLTRIMIILTIIFFYGCESNFKNVQKNNFSEFLPGGEYDTVDMRYTESGKIIAVLKSQKMLDYSNLEFPFIEFPKGIDLTLYDKMQNRTFIKASYAVSYEQTKIIDLQGKVKIILTNGQVFETEQLYYDQLNEWFFTERKFKLTDAKGTTNGQGIDFSKDFTVVNSQIINGDILLKE